MQYREILDEIIFGNKYLSLATADADATPWLSPVAYQYDKNNKVFYFISSPDSRHIVNATENPRVAFSIFSTSDTAGNAFGVQGSGLLSRVDSADVPSLLRGNLLSIVAMVVLNRSHEFYAIRAEEMYLPHAERWKEDGPFRTLVWSRNEKNPE